MSPNVTGKNPVLPTITLDTRNVSPLLLSTNQTKHKPSTPTNTIPTPKSTPSRLSTPTSITAPLTTFSRPRSCYLCDVQNPGDFSPTTRYLSTCQLCSRDFCPIHQHVQQSTICSVNHSQYYHQRLEQARQDIANSYQQRLRHDNLSIETEAQEILTQAGVFPSIGERERAIWRSNLVPNARTQPSDLQHTPHTQQRGMSEHGGSPLIETKEFIGADIAV